MNFSIRRMEKKDKPAVIEMMKDFYSSPAVFTNGSEEIFVNDIETCLSESPYLEGYIIEVKEEIQGYAMIAKSFSTEFGKPCIWIEDIFVKEQFRGLGAGNAFLSFITQVYTHCIFRLEVEKENETAVKLYEKFGFGTLPYIEMKR